MRAYVAGLVIICVSTTSLSAQSENCSMRRITKHMAEGGVDIWASQSGLPAIYYRANMDVNTDGSPISYHPNDPYGKGPAINNIVNAMYSATDKNGNRISCGPKSGACYEQWVSAFRGAKANKFHPKKLPRVSFKSIIASKFDPKLGWAVPCENIGPYQGYFISQTSANLDTKKGYCDQDRYLDSVAVNANVIPLGTRWSSQGIVTDNFDLVVVRDVTTGKVAFAVNGDKGPFDTIGEGSVRLTAELSSKPVALVKSYVDAKKLKRRDVQYLIFPSIDLKKIKGSKFSQDDVNAIGINTLEEWGGAEKLSTCK